MVIIPKSDFLRVDSGTMTPKSPFLAMGWCQRGDHWKWIIESLKTTKLIAPIERSGRVDEENDMVCYVWMCGSRDIACQIPKNRHFCRFSADVSILFVGFFKI